MPVFIRYNATVLVGASLYHVMKRNKDWLGWRRLRKRHESSRSAGGLRTQNSRGVELIWFGFAWLKWSFKWSVKQRCNEKRLINNFIILPIEIRWIKTYWGLHCACWGNQRTNYLSTLRKEKSTFLFLRKTETKKIVSSSHTLRRVKTSFSGSLLYLGMFISLEECTVVPSVILADTGSSASLSVEASFCSPSLSTGSA